MERVKVIGMCTQINIMLPSILQKQIRSVKWFTDYSNIIFRSFGKKVKTYITFNEPQIDLHLITPAVNNVIAKKQNPFAITDVEFAKQAQASHYLLLASAIATKNYHKL